MRSSPLAALLLLGSFTCATIAWSDENPPPLAPAHPIAAEEIERLAAAMDADSFSERQAASQRLGEMGPAAFPALEKAVAGSSREAASRALDILKKHLDGGDEATKAAAKETLERLAQSDIGAVARRASEALSPPQPVALANRLIAPARLIRPQVQIRANNPRGNVVRRVSVRVVNGVKTVDAEENGRKVKYVDDPAKGIEMEVTEAGKTQKYSAKNAEELKQKHPAAHKLYEEYANGLRIQVGAAPVVPAAPADRAERLTQHYEKVIQSLDRSIETYRQRGDNENAKRIIENLEKIKHDYQQQRDRTAAR